MRWQNDVGLRVPRAVKLLDPPPPVGYDAMADRGFSMQRAWWRSKKVWGTILAAVTLGVGAHEGWDAATTLQVAACFMGGVTVEGVIDAVAAYKRKD